VLAMTGGKHRRERYQGTWRDSASILHGLFVLQSGQCVESGMP
jgi:hypothetical protein